MWDTSHVPGTVPGTVDPKMNKMKVQPLGADSLVGETRSTCRVFGEETSGKEMLRGSDA